MQQQSVTPYSFDGMEAYPHIQPAVTHPGRALGVYITLHPDELDDIATKIERWFSERPEVKIIDVGTSDKQGLGFLLVEWIECEIDPLFLAILREEEAVGDYTPYCRILEG